MLQPRIPEPTHALVSVARFTGASELSVTRRHGQPRVWQPQRHAQHHVRQPRRKGPHGVTGSLAFGKLSVTSSMMFGDPGGKVGTRRVLFCFRLRNGPIQVLLRRRRFLFGHEQLVAISPNVSSISGVSLSRASGARGVRAAYRSLSLAKAAGLSWYCLFGCVGLLLDTSVYI